MCGKDSQTSFIYDEKIGINFESIDKSGTGQTKFDVMFYDIAYYNFAKLNSINVPEFIVHDIIETIDNNLKLSLFKLVMDESSEFGCQLIVPLLLHNTSDEIKKIIEDYKILELSTNDKFFKIEEFNN